MHPRTQRKTLAMQKMLAQNAAPSPARSAKGSLDLLGAPRAWGAAGFKGAWEVLVPCMSTSSMRHVNSCENHQSYSFHWLLYESRQDNTVCVSSLSILHYQLTLRARNLLSASICSLPFLSQSILKGSDGGDASYKGVHCAPVQKACLLKTQCWIPWQMELRKAAGSCRSLLSSVACRQSCAVPAAERQPVVAVQTCPSLQHWKSPCDPTTQCHLRDVSFF